MRIGIRNALRAETLLFAAIVAVALPQSREESPLKRVADVPLPGAAVRFDYQSLDASQGRLYIAHMNANQLVVFDTKKREVIANLDGFPSVHGVWAVPELSRVYASATGEHQLAVVDMKTLKTIARVGPINYPDGIAYAPSAKRVFVSDEHGNADAVIDTTTNKLITTIPLGGGAGNTVCDSGSGHILVAVHEKNELVAIDPATAKIIARYPLPGVESPHGIARCCESPRLHCGRGKPQAGRRRSHHDDGAVCTQRRRRPRRSCIRSRPQTTLCFGRIRKHHRVSRGGKIFNAGRQGLSTAWSHRFR